MPVDAEKNKLQNCYLGFLKFWKILRFFQNFLFKKKIPPNFKIKKTEYMY